MINYALVLAHWFGFHDDETDIWGYTWSIGTYVCGEDVYPFEDPHAHLAGKFYWTNQGSATNLLLPDGQYYITVQALNNIVYGGALVTSVCHSTPVTIDTSPPVLHLTENIFFDEEFDIMGIYYAASDPNSGIMRTDIGLGETTHDVFIRSYTMHDPMRQGFKMVSLDAVDLPEGVPIWVRIRLVNNGNKALNIFFYFVFVQ